MNTQKTDLNERNAENKKRKGFFAESLHVGVASQFGGAAVNLTLSILKIYIGLRTNCISILSDGYNNMGDFGGNVIGAVGIGLSGKKPSEKYPHGLGRLEDLVTFLMLIVFAIVGFYFVYSSVERLFFHPPIMFAWWSFGVVAATAAVKAAMYFGYAAAYRRFPSPVIRANMLDSLLDTAITLMTLLSYGLSAISAFQFDSLFGIIIGVTILVSIVKSAVRTLKKLIGDDTATDKAVEILSDAGVKAEVLSAESYGRRIEADVKTCGAEIPQEQIDVLNKNNLYIRIVAENSADGGEKEKL